MKRIVCVTAAFQFAIAIVGVVCVCIDAPSRVTSMVSLICVGTNIFAATMLYLWVKEIKKEVEETEPEEMSQEEGENR